MRGQVFVQTSFSVAGVLFLLVSGSLVLAQNYGKLLESVDKQKAADSVETEKLKAAYDPVDKGKAKDALVMEKAKAALLEK